MDQNLLFVIVSDSLVPKNAVHLTRFHKNSTKHRDNSTKHCISFQEFKNNCSLGLDSKFMHGPKYFTCY